jgi:two-component system, response regulator YesN
MTRILVVDDEFIVYDYLRELFDWKSEGYAICGFASNGRDALEKLESLRPDVLLVDVNMPVMNGIDLLASLGQTEPRPAVVMLSSYSDYEYVRRALKLGAADYLLKHKLTRDELLRVLRAIPERKEGRKEAPAEDLIRSALLGEGGEPKTAACESLPEGTVFAVADLHPAMYENGPAGGGDEEEAILSYLERLRRQIFDDERLRIVAMGGKRFVIVFPPGLREGTEEHLSRTRRSMSILRDSLLKYYGIYVIHALSGRISSCQCLQKEYAAAIQRLAGKRPEDPASEVAALGLDREKRLLQAVAERNLEAIRDILSGVLRPLYEEPNMKSTLNLVAGDVITLALKLHRQRGLSFDAIPEIDVKTGSREAVLDWLVELFKPVLLSEGDSSNPRWSALIRRALDFVEQRYRSDIGLVDIAQACNVNQAYLSHQFKKETGMGMVQYLHRLRIRYAVERLSQGDAPARLVAEESGFRHYNHFFTLFKALTGFNPTDFANNKDAVLRSSLFDPLP